MRTSRINESTEDIDQLENQWWNDNSELIEKIWAHTYSLQKCIRYPYLKKAKTFLLGDGGKKTIWEVGCGTGWVCRMIADKDLNVVGTDFAKAQIDTATRLAVAFNKQSFCKYEVSDASSVIEGHDGIVISALLHHLTKVELEGFFKVMAAQRKGVKLFLYEPVFIQSTSDSGKVSATIVKTAIKIFNKVTSSLVKTMGSENKVLMEQANTIFNQAEVNGWFISPKEIPFYEDELNGYLDPLFTVNDKYFVNSTDFMLAQSLVLNNMENPPFIFTKVLLPIATFLDRSFFKTNFRSISKGQYFFCCYELTKK